jgi:aminopeptidase N
VYAFQSTREYINSVYLRGAKMLHALRETFGSDAFFAWMEAYARANAGRIAQPDSLWSLLTPAQLAAADPIRREYMSETYAPPAPTPDSRGN